ncbi:hypothetical protein R0381_002573 [Jeongeupia wiesaeckerbachi]|uniref:hypothetical protein n=1 Tax=Jeongeupia wiesaeckerbachi TaxID=3051218 RepID=UPI003D806048
MHTLTTIRHALVDLLVNRTAAGASVWASQAKAYGDGSLPALHIRLNGRDTQTNSDIPSLVHRGDLTIAIVVASNADDLAETLLEQVEGILAVNPTLNGVLAQPLQPTQLLATLDLTGTAPLTVYTQRYLANWHEEPFDAVTVTEAATAPAFGDLKRLHADIDASPFESSAEHNRWLAGDYAGSRPEAQADILLTGPSP